MIMLPSRFLSLVLAWLVSAGAAACAATPAAATAPARTPNILLLFLDNVGYGDIGCYGNQTIKTPHLDALAADGVICTDFYTASPSCTPSRGAILTGRHPERNGLNWQLSTQQNIAGYGLPLTERIIPQYLKPHGYATGAFGKWNLGFGPGARPTERGFDEFLGHASGNIHYYKHLYAGQNDLRKGTEPLNRRGEYSTDLFADAAIDFINRHREQTWFAYVPFNAAHFVSKTNVDPEEKIEWQVPAKFLALYGCPPDEPDHRKRFAAVMTALDDAIGRVLRAVDETGARERTLVMCISDNGAFMLPGRGLEEQSNGPLREGGVTTYEGGVRVPAIFRWPGQLRKGTRCSALLSSMDVLPMILSACAIEPPDDLILDGRDSTAALAGRAPSPHEMLCWTWKQPPDQSWQAIRSGNWKLVRSRDDAPWELYDLSRDIGEMNDLAAEQSELVQALSQKLAAHLEDMRNQ
jgi:arylsulfatase A-like enzyme